MIFYFGGKDSAPTVPPLLGCSGGCFIASASGSLPWQHQWSQHHLASLPGALRPAPGQGRDGSELSKALHFPNYAFFPREGRGIERGQAASRARRPLLLFSVDLLGDFLMAQRTHCLAGPRRDVISRFLHHTACLSHGWIY